MLTKACARSWKNVRRSSPAARAWTCRRSIRGGDGSARSVVLVALALANARAQLGRHRRPRLVHLRVHRERLLVGPELQEREPIRVGDALEDLELLAAGLLARLGAAPLVHLRQLVALARR